jgi:hypothetical protein
VSADTPGLVQALKSMDGEAPSALLEVVAFMAKKGGGTVPDEATVVEALTTPDVNDAARVRFQLLISRWDAAQYDGWTGATGAHTAPRRALVHTLLGLGDTAVARLDALYPRDPGAVIIEAADGDWTPWYDRGRHDRSDFYWKAYSEVLERDPGFDPVAVARLDTATTAVVRRLADPTWGKPYQSKGLVVGYVQSGKTANFTGVIAKAIDAGYRLVIVLTGTVEILRRQTQRRLDMELVGVENILGGIDEADDVKVATTDYHDDQDWKDGKFLRHGIPVHTTDSVPTIRRLSTFGGDYHRLQQGLSTLDFRAGHELVDKNRPLYDPINLFTTDVRLAVVKKNSRVLERLVADLGEIHADLREIPTLIIDDEADQASVNTRKQKQPKTTEEKERSAVNKQIAALLKILPRCQYIGYTATPFANVFIDPDDSEDLFPKDFIVSLDRPAGYMGARDFHDLDSDFAGETKTVRNSNEKAFVRDLVATTSDREDAEMQSALDAFVLTGALKLFRRNPLGEKFRHHTMLVHESLKKADHAVLADRIRELWKRAGYSTPVGLERLQGLFDDDFAPVVSELHERAVDKAAQAGGNVPTALPMPASFEDLVRGGWVGQALDLIDAGTSPVIVVNGDSEKDYAQDALDFQGSDVWKILVGGAKLSRGFTVEGLTVTYYTRRTQQADTLMQMGRWFGFRRGYGDLIRLYIGRNVPAPHHEVTDLYEAFEAVVRDEEDFRAELVRYAAVNQESGHPLVRPEDVPPMVFQQVPWLKPTSTTKMYNAELVRQGVGGRLSDFPAQADRGTGKGNAAHFAAVQPLLDGVGRHGTFEYRDPTTGQVSSYEARYGIVDARRVRDAVAAFTWVPDWSFAPRLAFLDDIIAQNQLTDFVVLLPDLAGAVRRTVGSRADLPILMRRRRSERQGFSGSSKRQRDAVQTIAGRPKEGSDPYEIDAAGGPLAVSLHTATRAAILLTFALDTGVPDAKPSDLPAGPVAVTDVATLFSWALPYAAAPNGRIGFKARKSGAGAIIRRGDGN